MAHTYEYMYWYQSKDSFKLFSLIWNMTGKAAFIPAVVAKDRDTTNLTGHFRGGHLLHKAVRHPRLPRSRVTKR